MNNVNGIGHNSMKVYAVMLDTEFGGVICHDFLTRNESDAIEEVNRLNTISHNGLYYVKELEVDV